MTGREDSPWYPTMRIFRQSVRGSWTEVFSRMATALRDLASRALRGLAGFAKALKVKYRDIEVGLDFDPEPGLADNGDLEHDLQALFETVGAAARQCDQRHRRGQGSSRHHRR